MKSYVLVHHRCEQDPRVIQVLKTIGTTDIDATFVGIGNTPPSPAYKNWIHIPPARLRDFAHLPLPVFQILYDNSNTVVFKVLVTLALPILALVTVPLVIAVLVLKSISKLARRSGKIKKTKATVQIVNLARRVVAPLRFSFVFIKIFLAHFRYLKNKTDIDVIHCNDLETLLVGVYFKIARGSRLIYDAHEFFPHQASWLKGTSRKILESYERFLISKSDFNFMVSRPLAKVMGQTYSLKKDFIIVPNVFSRSGSEFPIMPRDGYPVKFHYMGGFLEERGIEFLISQWTKVDPGKAALYLRGPANEYHDRCVELAKKNLVFGRSVFFPDAIEEHKLIQVASEFDVGIIPYLPVNLNNKFCCPNKLFQYMMAGNAVLANNLPNVSEIISKYECGISYDFEAPDSFLNAVDQLLKLDLLQKMRANGRSAAIAEYNWEVQGMPFLDLYRSF